MKIMIITSYCTSLRWFTCPISLVFKKSHKLAKIYSVFFCLQVRLTGQVTTLWAQLAQHWLSTRLHHNPRSQPSNHSWRLCLRGTGTLTTALLSPSTQTSRTCVSFISQCYKYHISLHQCTTGGHFCSTHSAVVAHLFYYSNYHAFCTNQLKQLFSQWTWKLSSWRPLSGDEFQRSKGR